MATRGEGRQEGLTGQAVKTRQNAMGKIHKKIPSFQISMWKSHNKPVGMLRFDMKLLDS